MNHHHHHHPGAPGVGDDDVGVDEIDGAELERELAASDAEWGDRLRDLLAPEDDLSADTARRIDGTLRQDSALVAALDLMSLGWRTALEVLTDHGVPADGDPEGSRHG